MCLGFEWVRKCIAACTLSLVKGKTWGTEEQISLSGGICFSLVTLLQACREQGGPWLLFWACYRWCQKRPDFQRWCFSPAVIFMQPLQCQNWCELASGAPFPKGRDRKSLYSKISLTIRDEMIILLYFLVYTENIKENKERPNIMVSMKADRYSLVIQ